MKASVRWGVLSVLFCACAAGCGDKKHPAELQGTWKCTDIASGSVSAQNLAAQKAALPRINLRLKFDADGKMTASTDSITLGTMNVPARSDTGTWEVDGGNLKLTGGVSSVSGQAKAGKEGVTVPYKLTNGGKTLSFSQTNAEMTFTKQ